MATLLTVHNIVRWLAAIVAIAVLVKYLIGWFGKGKFTDLDSTLGRVFAGTMTLQFVLGIATLVMFATAGAFNAGRHMEHATYGLLATALSHMTAMFRRKDDTTRFRNSALMILGALVLVFFSVTRLRGSFFYG
jgi:Na+(H+)/acetate symporter ActP